MASYKKYKHNILNVPEGNVFEYSFEIDSSNFDIADVAEVSFQARTSSGTLLFAEKLRSTGDIEIVDFTVTVGVTASEMRGISGLHEYGLDFINSDGDPFATIQGKFYVDAEINDR